MCGALPLGDARRPRESGDPVLVSGAKAQFESLGDEGWDELTWIVSTTAIEMCCLESAQVDRWIDLTRSAMERIIRILNLPPAQFTVTASPTRWPIPVGLVTMFPNEDTNLFPIA